MAIIKKELAVQEGTPALTPELRRKLEVLRADFPKYAAINLKIKTKAGAIEPFILNPPQLYLHEQIEKQIRETGKARIIGLKGRQQGFSTYTEGRFYWKTSLNRGKSAYILAHEQAASETIFKMAKRYHDNSYEAFKPTIGSSNVKELLFSKMDSGYKVGTAGSKAVGRSGTHQYFHGSEVSAWENAYEHFAGVMECIPEEPGTEIILESTARGCSGKFYDLWMQSVRGEGDYIAVFVPWFWTPEYTRDATGFEPTAEEIEKQKVYGVSLEALAWRRGKVNSMGKDLADQEYPYCWQDSFLASGRTRFDVDELGLAMLECWTPKKRMSLEGKKFVETKDGSGLLRVWEDPKPGDRYAIGADVALGIKGGDYSCADVLEVRSGRQLAQWHGHIAPDLFADVLANLGKLYNNSLLCVESNNHGLTTNIRLRDNGYSNLYVQTVLQDRGSDSKETKKIGFDTQKNSKRYIIDELAALFRDQYTGIACKETIAECQTYIITENGATEAAPKCFDDRVMSMAIAKYAVSQSPAYKKAHRY
jgi:hypothetical protein